MPCVPHRPPVDPRRERRVPHPALGLAIPIQAIIVPLYLLIYKLHLYDTLFALMLTMSAAAVPVSVLVMVSFVRDIPRELIGAMLVDGGTEWTVFRRLIVPLSKPVLATLSIYDGLNVWDNFILPLVLTQSNSVAVLPLGLTKLEGAARPRPRGPWQGGSVDLVTSLRQAGVARGELVGLVVSPALGLGVVTAARARPVAGG